MILQKRGLYVLANYNSEYVRERMINRLTNNLQIRSANMQYRYDKEKIQFPCLLLAACVLQKKRKINLEKAEAEILEAMKLGSQLF